MEIKINEKIVYSDKAISFYEASELAGFSFRRPCGGNGRCLRCGIKFDYGASEVTEADVACYDHKELNDGWRIGCQCTITKDCKITVPIQLLGEIKAEAVAVESAFSFSGDLGVAVDIGTTTIAVAIVELFTGKTVGTATSANPHIKYGADVVSRIQSAMSDEYAGLAAELRNAIADTVGKVIHDYTNIKRVVCVGNTTMLHLLMGYPVDGLAAYPFKPYTLEGMSYEQGNCKTFLFPGISAFVGGDIVAGMYAIDMIEKDEKSLFVDLGTNAEACLWDGQKLYTTSSSAGPALEGGNISCGVPAVEGAICHVSVLPSGVVAVETIEKKSPVGICGSGIIDAVYELHKAGIIDNGGIIRGRRNEYKLAENAVLTDEDIQQVLLCKSAICSSIIVLCKRAGLELSEIDKVYVAGGIGVSINMDSAVGLGIFPSELRDKLQPVGNTALKGAIKFLTDFDDSKLKEIVEKTHPIELANSEQFQELFTGNLFI